MSEGVGLGSRRLNFRRVLNFLLARLAAAALSFKLVDFRVYQKPVPEPLKEVVYESFAPIEKTKPDNVAVEEVEKGPQKHGRALIAMRFRPPLPPRLPFRGRF